jgi:NADPH-dependent F420 reductase
MPPLGIVGGTGAEGLGLALRFASAGEPLVIGSRAAERAAAAADRVRAAVPNARVEGVENAELLARSDRLVLALPFAGLSGFLAGSGPRLAGKLVIDPVVPLAARGGRLELLAVPGAASAAELIRDAAPGARVVSAFKNLSAEWLRDLSRPLAGDVVVCGDDPTARAEVRALVARLPGLRPVDGGPLSNARYLEAVTALLLELNRLHRAQTTIAILGLPEGGGTRR